MRTAKNLARHELIGLRVQIEHSPDPTLVGLRGVVVDETKNTFRVQTPRGEKVIPKDDNRFVFYLEDGTPCVIEGRRIRFRPEDRIKKVKG